MEYTDKEKQILSFMDRTDFKNLSKSDLFTYASKLNELRPEVAAQVIAQFPELVNLTRSSLTEYKGILDSVIASDDASLNQVYDIINKEMDRSASSWNEYISFADKVRSDCSKCLNTPNLTPEQQQDILDREIEVLRIVGLKETESRNQQQAAAELASQKDSEKRVLNWKVIGTASTLVLAAVGIGAAMLGGKLDIKLPTRK